MKIPMLDETIKMDWNLLHEKDVVVFEKKKHKIYIAGKITGDKNYIEKFAETQEALELCGWEVLNPAADPEIDGWTWGMYMARALAKMFKCEAIYMLRDWKDSTGAPIEHEWANRTGMIIRYQN